jgi:DNA-binding MarR family transcriptional regulator
MFESSDRSTGIAANMDESSDCSGPCEGRHGELPQEALDSARAAYAARRLRDRMFGDQLFSDPAWDLLLDLYIAHWEGRQVSVKSACIAASVPQTTALRYIAHLVELAMIKRSSHPVDARIKFLQLSERAIEKMTRYFTRSPGSRAQPATNPGEPPA